MHSYDCCNGSKINDTKVRAVVVQSDDGEIECQNKEERKQTRDSELQYMDVNHAFQLEAVVAVKGEQDPDE